MSTEPSERSAWGALVERVRPHRRTLAVSIVLALLGAAAGLAQPLAAREIIEALADDRSLLTPLLMRGAGSDPVHGCVTGPGTAPA